MRDSKTARQPGSKVFSPADAHIKHGPSPWGVAHTVATHDLMNENDSHRATLLGNRGYI